MINLTTSAITKVRNVQASKPEFAGKPFRVFVQAGGCSGYNYGFNFDEVRDGDAVLKLDGIDIVVDPQSLKLIDGATVDWVEDFTGAGFSVKNPKATASCGCGTSFTVDDSHHTKKN
jgi:iron-sulfur cluster insertion protein